MSHELDMTTGQAACAFTGSRENLWHHLGQEMAEDQPIEEWIVQSGLDWTVEQSDVAYKAGSKYIQYPDRKVLYRSDTKTPLSVVSKDFKVVQPKQIVEFFRALVEQHDMKLSTAGSLFGGRKFWALAELGKSAEIVSGDKIDGYLLLTTAVDGSLRTTGKFVSERVCCQNTLSIALAEGNKTVVAVSHRSEWDAEQVKVDLGLIDEGWFNFIKKMRKLAETPITEKQVKSFYQHLIFEEKKLEPTRAELRKVEKLIDLYQNGMGADLGRGSAWNALNAVTEMYTHGTGRKDPSAQMWDSLVVGAQDNLKTKAMNMALALV